MSAYFDRAGQPITMSQWLTDFPGNSVKVTEVRSASVSTVWLGLDHSFGEGPPLIFETMVFGDQQFEDVQYRYSTEAEALAGHDAVVEQVRTAVPA